ncbi:non-homologous end joining protein Ku [Microlunatus antarcticus]
MRAVWTGAITFGLVNVPVKLYSATQDHDVSLHQVHGEDGGRIRYQRTCEVCGKTIEYADIDKAYEEGGATVVLTADDLKALPVERSREIEVVEFVPSEQIDPVRFDRSYFLEPDANAAKAYALLLETLKETERTAVVQFSLRQKTRLGALRAYGDVMMLQSLLWDDEVREADFDAVKNPPKVSAGEKKMASSLVENMAADFAPDRFTDDYQEQLRTLVAAKLEQGDALDTAATFGEEPEAEGTADVIDLVEALRRSVEANREKRASSSGGAGGEKEGAATKKPTAKKAAAKKPAAKKAAPKKTAEKKSADKKAPAKKAAAKKSA